MMLYQTNFLLDFSLQKHSGHQLSTSFTTKKKSRITTSTFVLEFTSLLRLICCAFHRFFVNLSLISVNPQLFIYQYLLNHATLSLSDSSTHFIYNLSELVFLASSVIVGSKFNLLQHGKHINHNFSMDNYIPMIYLLSSMTQLNINFCNNKKDQIFLIEHQSYIWKGSVTPYHAHTEIIFNGYIFL
jgi:hypothetical protein